MKIQVTYDESDLLKMIENDLERNGLTLSNPDISFEVNKEDYTITVKVEQDQ